MILICAIVVVAFAIRIAFLVSWDQRNFYGKLSLEQGAVALSLLDGHGIATGDSVRNFIEYDRFIPLRGSAIFENVWAGWGEYRDNPFGAILSDSKTFEQAQEEGFEGDYGTPEFDAFMRGKVIDAIKTDPIWIAGAIVRRAENLALPNLDLGVAMYPSQRWGELGGGQAGGTRTVKLLLDYPELIPENKTFLFFLIVKRLGGASLLILSVVTSIITWRSWRLTAPLWAIALYSWAIILPVHYEPRYAVGGTMAYLILASLGLAMSWQWVHGMLRRRAIGTE